MVDDQNSEVPDYTEEDIENMTVEELQDASQKVISTFDIPTLLCKLHESIAMAHAHWEEVAEKAATVRMLSRVVPGIEANLGPEASEEVRETMTRGYKMLLTHNQEALTMHIDNLTWMMVRGEALLKELDDVEL